VPTIGESAQDVINSQIVDKADILIGVFYNRLGTPTRRAVSGTAEEINRAVEKDKFVHLYFASADVPVNADLEQLKRLHDFRARIQSDSLVSFFDNENELRAHVLTALDYDIEFLRIKDSPAPVKLQKSFSVILETYASGARSLHMAQMLVKWLRIIFPRSRVNIYSHSDSSSLPELSPSRYRIIPATSTEPMPLVRLVCLTRDNVDSVWAKNELNMEIVSESLQGDPPAIKEHVFPVAFNVDNDALRDSPSIENLNRFDDDGLEAIAIMIDRLSDNPAGIMAIRAKVASTLTVLRSSLDDMYADDQFDAEREEAIRKVRGVRVMTGDTSYSSGQTPSKLPDRPLKIFIGSSTEGLSYANDVQRHFDYSDEPTVWNQDFFSPSSTAIEDLTENVESYDCAIFVLTPDDDLIKRGKVSKAPRDNLIFELGLFMGAMGRKRTYILHPRSLPLDLPTDLMGVSTVGFRLDLNNPFAGLGAACTTIRVNIKKLGPR